MSTSAKPKTPSPKSKPAGDAAEMLNARGERVDRPFDPKLLRAAAGEAERYQITLAFEDGDWYGRILDMPNVMNHGKTPNAAVKATREMLTTVIAYHMEEGDSYPPPADERRTQQVNVRVSPAEKLQIEQLARREGFRGVGDYLRHAALARR